MTANSEIQGARPQEPWERQSRPPANSRRSLELRIADLERKLAAPDRAMAIAELTRCLVLTVPSGMTADDRKAWLRAAFDEVLTVPSYCFAEACAHARRVADHPAKIIPAIHAYKPEYVPVSSMRTDLFNARQQLANLDAKRLAAPADEITDEEREDVAAMMTGLRQSMQSAPKPQPAFVVKSKERPRRRYCSVCFFASDNPLTEECTGNRGASCGLHPDFVPESDDSEAAA